MTQYIVDQPFLLVVVAEVVKQLGFLVGKQIVKACARSHFVQALQPRPTFSHPWLFIGGIKDVFKLDNLPKCWEGTREKQLVEVLVFYQDSNMPLSLPLISDVQGNELVVWFQADHCSSIPRIPLVELRLHRPKEHQCQRADLRAQLPAAATLLIPPSPVPCPHHQRQVGHYGQTIHTKNYTLGKHREIIPMCSMKASFMPNMEFVWPTKVILPWLRFRVSWRVGHDRQLGATTTVCPLTGKDGCTEEPVRG
ncbi:uncharacterized protein B0H18DRAFT_1125243 [Fomitopsis serialis]|uniref:uncharacterized protein n=1 Tax=Fomitopsis serialis TaxID=139415 RepID=UPI0020074809|nr:uncharacterized protein B0H18DRAFT_1125243 [Neoantrodia serialis]KAH9914856.1 hypothetical protein B0H18DRAFT_1125243 [Neoantrodia serialis]